MLPCLCISVNSRQRKSFFCCCCYPSFLPRCTLSQKNIPQQQSRAETRPPSKMASSSRLRPAVTLPLLLLLLLLPFLSSRPLVLADVDASGRHRRLLVLPASTHKSEQRMRVDGDRKPLRNTGASLGRRKIPRSFWNPIHNR